MSAIGVCNLPGSLVMCSKSACSAIIKLCSADWLLLRSFPIRCSFIRCNFFNQLPGALSVERA